MKRCRLCLIDKDLSQFYSYKRSLDGFQYWCKKCQADRRAENLKKQRANDPEFRAMLVQWQRENIQAARNEIIRLLGGRCVDCGEDTRLEVDHVYNDGPAHRAEFGGAGLTYFRDVLRQVIDGSDRFQLLCKSDHGRKTRLVALCG